MEEGWRLSATKVLLQWSSTLKFSPSLQRNFKLREPSALWKTFWGPGRKQSLPLTSAAVPKRRSSGSHQSCPGDRGGVPAPGRSERVHAWISCSSSESSGVSVTLAGRGDGSACCRGYALTKSDIEGPEEKWCKVWTDESPELSGSGS